MVSKIGELKKTVGRIFINSVSFAIILSAVVFAYISLVPIDVLKDWHYTIHKDTYSTGETILITSTYRKVRAITGNSRRYIYCKTPSGSYNRKELGDAPADRPPQAGTTDIYLSIPTDLPTLPTTCYIEVDIDYTIYTFRKFVETNRTAEFTVIEGKNTPNVTSGGATSGNVIAGNPPIIVQNEIQPSPEEDTTAPESEDSPVTPNNQPGVINRAVDGIQNGVSKLLKGITNIL